MRDCKLIVTIKNDIVNFEGVDISVEELAKISGFLQVFVGQEGLKRGLNLDDIKDNMLDIHLAAMEAIEEQLLAGGIDLKGRSGSGQSPEACYPASGIWRDGQG